MDVGEDVGVLSEVGDVVGVAVLLVGEGVWDEVFVIVGLRVRVFVGSTVNVSVGKGVRLFVGVGEGVKVVEGVSVSEGVILGVSVIVGINVWVGGNGVKDGVKEGNGVAMIGVAAVIVFVGGMVIVGVGTGRVFMRTVIIPAQ